MNPNNPNVFTGWSACKVGWAVKLTGKYRNGATGIIEEALPVERYNGLQGYGVRMDFDRALIDARRFELRRIHHLIP